MRLNVMKDFLCQSGFANIEELNCITVEKFKTAGYYTNCINICRKITPTEKLALF